MFAPGDNFFVVHYSHLVFLATRKCLSEHGLHIPRRFDNYALQRVYHMHPTTVCRIAILSDRAPDLRALSQSFRASELSPLVMPP